MFDELIYHLGQEKGGVFHKTELCSKLLLSQKIKKTQIALLVQ